MKESNARGGRQDSIVLLLALVALFIPVALIEYNVLHQTNGTFVYPLDDTFIHMALARNLSFFHTWGMDRYEFSSASSSILYTLLLAGTFRIFSVHTVIPFVINCIAGIFLILSVQRWLRKQQVSTVGQLILFFCLIFFTPLPILIISGMEHTLQCLFFFLFVTGLAAWLEREDGEGGTKTAIPWPVLLYGMLLCFIRYEGLFPIGIAGLMLLYRGRWGQAVKLGLVAALPLMLFGIYSLVKGSYFLPNSVLLKSESVRPSIGGLLQYIENILIQKLTVVKTDGLAKGTPRPGISLLSTQRLLIILPLTYFVFIRQLRQQISFRVMLLMLTACTILQLCLASTGWLYRYEAYLVFFTVLLIGVLVYRYGKEVLPAPAKGVWLVAGVILFALFFPFFLRSSAAYTKTGTACVNIYQQQYQMGSFIGKYYDSTAVAVNDIGVISYFSHAHNIDLWGLGSFPVARSRKQGVWTPAFLDSISRKNQVKLAIVFDSWFSDSLLHKWTRVANWKIPDNVICGDDNVSFYALDKEGAADLKKNLQEYGKSLPPAVSVTYYP